MEFYERAAKLGVPDIHITEEEWQKNYNNSYSVLALDGSDMDKILAAQDIIKIYLVLQAEIRPTQRAVDASPDTCEHGFMRGNCYVEICSFSKYGERN
jgi:hypothetical protein